VDPRDIQRGTLTYTVDSMVALRQTFPRSPLCFFIGTDSLRSLSSWHQWSTLFSYCHFIVCQRADQSTLSLEQHGPVQAQQQQKLLLERQTHNILDLHTSLAGRIYLADTPTVNISSTVIKQRLAAHQSVQDMLPSTVLDYIEQYKLYPPYMDF
jgi:nicotinate-nucleotide adenylyltransferase